MFARLKFWLVSGVVLLIGYPTKSLMTPAFYVKIALIAAAMVVMVRLEKRLPASLTEALDAGAVAKAAPLFAHVRPLAVWSVILWFGAITAGRLIAYTAKYVTYP